MDIATEAPTETVSSSPTATGLPVATDLPPEPELTAELLAHLTERPETGEMRLSMLEDVYEVSYYYDADGNMMESVVRAQTGDLINIQWTIYINRYYERQIDYVIDTTTSQVIEVDYYYRKYYYAGNTRIAMRYYEDGVPTQYWLLTDQVNSQSVTLNEDGTLHSEVRYTAFGETRYTTQTDTPTDYLYTGQRLDSYINMYWYTSRWYDPALAHFNQPDTIVPDPYNSQDWDRFSYVGNNPIRYTDPSGHMRTEEDSYYKGSTGNGNTEQIFKAILKKKYPNVTLLGDLSIKELTTVSHVLKLTYVFHGSNIESYTHAVGNFNIINIPYSGGMAPPYANTVFFPDSSLTNSTALYDLTHEIGHRFDFNGSEGDPHKYKSQLFVDVFAPGCNVGALGCLGSQPRSIYRLYNLMRGGNPSTNYYVSERSTSQYAVQQGSVDDFAETYANQVFSQLGLSSQIDSRSDVDLRPSSPRRIIMAVWVDLAK